LIAYSVDFANSCVALHIRPLLKLSLQSPQSSHRGDAINLPTYMIGLGLAPALMT
jgi:hypothetical protein